MLDRINLVPQKPLSEKLKKGVPLFFFLLMLLIVLFIHQKQAGLNGEIKQLENAIGSMQERQESYDQLTGRTIQDKAIKTRLAKQNGTLQQDIRNLQVVQTRKRKFSALLKDIAQAVPSSIICTRISFSRKAGEITGISKGYEELPEFIENLKKSDQLKRVTLKAINRDPKTSKNLFEYQISAELNTI